MLRFVHNKCQCWRRWAWTCN